MDGTVTLSRSRIDSKMKKLLSEINKTVAIISGSHNPQMHWQMDALPIIKMGQNGNHTVDTNEDELWFDKLTESEKTEIMCHVDAIRKTFTYPVPDEDDLLEDRGSQISLSIYGHNADPYEKQAFDGDFSKRKLLLHHIPFQSKALEVKMGGSTCLDYFKKGRNKGYNIKRLIERKGWKHDECIFFGDALFEGGNDETVKGVIKTVQVTDPNDCYQKILSVI